MYIWRLLDRDNLIEHGDSYFINERWINVPEWSIGERCSGIGVVRRRENWERVKQPTTAPCSEGADAPHAENSTSA